MKGEKTTQTRVLVTLVAALLMVFGVGAAGHAVTADGDLSDIRALPNAVELADPDGVTDEPILQSQFKSGVLSCYPGGGVNTCVSPSGFNIGSIVVAYDPVANNGTYYIGLDVSNAPGDDTAFGDSSVAWDADGDLNSAVITHGSSTYLDPAIASDLPSLTKTEKYTLTLDIQQNLSPDIEIVLLDQGSGPIAAIASISGSPTLLTGWSSGDKDVEFEVRNVNSLGLGDCDYYLLTVIGFADTDWDSAEEEVILPFDLPRPLVICKEDAAGEPVIGWEFSISINGGGPETVVTGDGGCVEIDAPAGSSVQICEVLPQDALNVMSGVTVNGEPVTPDNPSEGVYCVTVDADDCPTIVFTNECSADIVVYKYNLASCEDELATGAPVEGFVFHITGGGLDEDLPATDASGMTSITVDADATYTICESLPQEGIDKNAFCAVLVDDEPVAEPGTGPWCADVTVGCDELGEEHTVEFYNACEADIVVYKYNLASCEDELATGAPVEGFIFHITGGGLDEDLPATDASGMTSITVAADATYTICESLPQEGIDKNAFCAVLVDDEPVAEPGTGPWCADVTVGCDELGEEHTVEFYNACEADIVVYKYNLATCEDELATGAPVEGFVFHITGGGLDEDLPATDASGMTSITVGAGATYTICESLPQEGIDKNAFCAALVDDEPVAEPGTGPWCADVTVGCDELGEEHTVKFYNACEREITVQKMILDSCEADLGTGIPAPNFDFTISGPGIPVPITLTTGAAGEPASITVQPGTFLICETLPQGEVTEFCAVTVDGVPATSIPDTNTWCVEVTAECDPSGGAVAVVFYNPEVCEVEVEICKIAIQSATCDEMADSGPQAGWEFTLKELPDGPETPYTTQMDGCTDTIVLEPGDYRVCESMGPGFEFCWLEVNGVPVEPQPVPDNGTVCYDFTVSCEDVALGKEITFANAGGGATRTPGYWFTHPDALKAAFECITGSETGTIDWGCCQVTADDAMAIFWNSKGGNRPTLAKHVLAAMFNSCLLTPAPAGIIDAGIAVLCDPAASNTAIGAVLGPLTDFNESGTEQEIEGLEFGPADPAEAKGMAAMGTVPDCAAGKNVRVRGSRGR